MLEKRAMPVSECIVKGRDQVRDEHPVQRTERYSLVTPYGKSRPPFHELVLNVSCITDSLALSSYIQLRTRDQLVRAGILSERIDRVVPSKTPADTVSLERL